MVNELATGYVSIVAETRGMGKAILGELGRAQSSAGRSGKAIGTALKKGITEAAPVDVKQLEQNFEDAERRREAAVRRTTETIEGLRRKEAIAQKLLNEAEGKYSKDSVQYLRAKDRHVTATQKLRKAEAEAKVEVTRADKAVDEAKESLDDYTRSQEKAGRFGKAFSGAKGAFRKLKGYFNRAAADGEEGGEKTGRRFSLGLRDKLSEGTRGIGGMFKSMLGANLVADGVRSIASGLRSYMGAAVEASDATDKFKSTLNFAGIGKDQIEALTKSAQKYADLTVYDLNDIQSITAQLAANSVKDFDKLAEAAGNLNAVAGGNKDTFASVGMVLTQTAGAGKLTGENWRQLSDAIPGASGKIKDALLKNKAYTGDFAKALSDGQVSAEEFNQAILDLGFEDAAVKAAQSTTTFEGAWGNFEAAIEGGLARILTVLKPWATGALNVVTAAIEPVFAKVAGITEQLAQRLDATLKGLKAPFEAAKGEFTVGLQAFASSWQAFDGDITSAGFPGWMEQIAFNLRTLWEGLKDALSGFIDGFGGLDTVFGVFKNLLPLVTGPLGLIRAALADVFAPGSLDFGALGRAFGQHLAPILTSISGLIGRVGGAIGTLVAGVMPTLKAGFEQMRPSISALVQAFSPFVDAIGRVIEFVAPILVPALKMLASILIDSVKGAIDGVTLVLRGLTDVFNGVVDFVQRIFVGDIIGAFKGLGTALWGVLKTIAGGIWTWMNVTIVNAVRGGLAKAVGFFTRGWTNIRGIFTGALNGIKGSISGSWNTIKTVTSSVWNGIKSMISGLINGIKSTVMGVARAMSKGLSGIWGGISKIASRIWGGVKKTVTGVVESLKGAVEKAFETLVENIGSIWNGVQSAVKAPIKFVVDTVINKGLIGSFNSLVKKIGLTGLVIKDVTLPKGFAEGGWTGPGPKYQPAGVVHADEHVWTKEEMRRFPGGHKRMEQWREAIRRGDHSFQLGGYAKGGRVKAPFSGGSWNGGYYRSGKFHGGVDYPRSVGTAVRAAESGSVISARRLTRSYGIHAIVRGVWDMVYAHMSRMLVHAGQQVRQGQVIGAVGSTGNSTGPHLHWEVRPRGAGHRSAVNPLAVASGALAGGGSVAEESPVDKLKGMLSSAARKLFDFGKAAVDAVGEFLKDPMGNITRALTGAVKASGGAGIIGQIVDAIPGKVIDALKTYAKDMIGFAGGTTSAPSGWAWVGERGPELVRFRGGEQVLSNRDSMRAIGGTHVTQHNTIQLPDWVKDLDDVLAFLRGPELAYHLG